MTIEIDPKVKALIFDLDGTLSDSIPVHVASWHMVCAELGCSFDEGIVSELTGSPTINFAKRIQEDNDLAIDPEEIVRRKQIEFWKNAHKVKANWPVVNLVKKYHKKLPMAVGTGAGRRSAEIQLETLQIKEYFDCIVTADDVLKHKPDPFTFTECARLMNVAPEDCLVFEDGNLGMQAARSAGMMLIDVNPYLKQQ